MYGYIQIYKPELKFREYDVYHSYYCGLCQSLQQKYKWKGKMLLSYDMTFLCLLLDGLYEPQEQTKEKRCIVKCCQCQTFQSSAIIEYAADMNVLLSYYNAKDDWMDCQDHKKHFIMKLFHKSYRTISIKYPEKVHQIELQLKRLSEIESSHTTDLDAASGCFGKILAEIFSYKADCWEHLLRQLGFFLGKFIYLLDAFDDMEQDQKSHNYNPFVLSGLSVQQCLQPCGTLLHMMIAECTACFEKLPIIKHDSILRNILYAGVWQQFNKKKKILLSSLGGP